MCEIWRFDDRHKSNRHRWWLEIQLRLSLHRFRFFWARFAIRSKNAFRYFSVGVTKVSGEFWMIQREFQEKGSQMEENKIIISRNVYEIFISFYFCLFRVLVTRSECRQHEKYRRKKIYIYVYILIINIIIIIKIIALIKAHPTCFIIDVLNLHMSSAKIFECH